MELLQIKMNLFGSALLAAQFNIQFAAVRERMNGPSAVIARNSVCVLCTYLACEDGDVLTELQTISRTAIQAEQRSDRGEEADATGRAAQGSAKKR